MGAALRSTFKKPARVTYSFASEHYPKKEEERTSMQPCVNVLVRQGPLKLLSCAAKGTVSACVVTCARMHTEYVSKGFHLF